MSEDTKDPQDHKGTCPICQQVLYGPWSKSLAYKMERHIKSHGKKKVADLVRSKWDADEHLMNAFSWTLATSSEDNDYCLARMAEREKMDKLPYMGPASIAVLEECAKVANRGRGYRRVLNHSPRMPVLVRHGLVTYHKEGNGYGMTLKGFKYLRNWGSNGTRK